MKATATADSNGNRRMGMYQSVSLTKGKTYTFSAYVNTEQVTEYVNGGGAYLAFMSTSGSILAAGDRVVSVTNASIEDGWQRVHVTYTPPSSGTYRVAALLEDAYTYAYFDDFQLETGSAPSSVNLLQHGSFNKTSEWGLGNFSTNSGTSPHTAVITATGSATAMKRASQTVPINGPATETYLLSGWAKASSAANTEEKLTDSTAEKNTSKRYFGLIAKCTYTDATKEYFYMPFNDDYTDWQYASCVIAPKKANQSKTIESITVFAAYDCNINTVYFDDISLRKEPCTTYTYDDKGNITAVNATGNSGADFTYASGTTKLTKSVTESNGTYTYEYKDSNNDHLVTKIKNDGVSMSITYDAMGNSTATTLASDSNTSIGSIKTSASYSSDGSQLVSQTNANGYTTSYGYNDKRQLNETTDNAGTAVQQTYYDSQRPKTTYISDVISVLNTYSKGSLTKIDRGGYISDNSTKQNQYYNLTYDGFGNMTKIAIGSRVLATYDYGSHNQNLKSMTYGNGSAVKYTYDNLDRVVLEETDTTAYAYFYDSEGSLAKNVDKNTEKAVNYQYDSLGRLIHSYQSVDDTVLQRTEHVYDTSNRISRQSWQLGSTTYSEKYTYDKDDGALTLIEGSGGVQSIAFGYDALKRLSYRYNYYFRQDYTYRDISSGSKTTTQVSSIAYSQRPGGTNFSTFTLGYSYDSLGNISKVTGTNNTAQNASYTYDQQGQLTKEVNTKGTYNYTYDTYGNIRSVSGKETHTYTYGNSEWLDLLTAYDDHSISYDAIGNPTNWYNTKAWNFAWQNGRQLATAKSGSTTISYTYDVAGIRDSKTVGSTVYNYLTQNGKVVQQSWNGNVMDFIYDENGRPYACIYKDALYYYVLNLQGDVIGLVNTSGAYVAKYTYDAWGRLLSGTGTMASTNPLRYRGYYYDNDTKLYYLGSRYYDPQVKRFVNADGYVSTGQDFIGYNMFTYCNSNPVSSTDADGDFTIGALAVAGALGGLSGLVGAAASGDSLAVGFVVGALTSSASVVFSAGFIGNLAISLIGEVYETLANDPMVSIHWINTFKSVFAWTFVDATIGKVGGKLLKSVGKEGGDFIVNLVVDIGETLVYTTADATSKAYTNIANNNTTYGVDHTTISNSNAPSPNRSSQSVSYSSGIRGSRLGYTPVRF